MEFFVFVCFSLIKLYSLYLEYDSARFPLPFFPFVEFLLRHSVCEIDCDFVGAKTAMEQKLISTPFVYNDSQAVLCGDPHLRP